MFRKMLIVKLSHLNEFFDQFVADNYKNSFEETIIIKNILIKHTWAKLVIAFLLMFGLFGFSAMGQDNSKQLLDDEAVTALVDELKEGLPDLIEDETQVTAITEKWDAHDDLAGKTKAQILNLLFADVKAVVADEETQNSVWAGWKEIALGDVKDDNPGNNDEKQPVTPVAPSTPVAAQRASPVTPNQIEPNIEVQRLGSYIDGPWTVTGAYFAEIHEKTPVCKLPPGARLTNSDCLKVNELKIPAGSPPEYLCERKEGKGNCQQYKGGWIAKTCKYGYSYFTWKRTASGAEGTVQMGDSLICTSGKTPVPGNPGLFIR
ncbi:MAG: hypothetical protein ABJA66_15350 [Actinomycetota bacterium]